MATTKRKDPDADYYKTLQRYVDQPGQWVDATPESVKRRQKKASAALMASLTPAQRKQMGLPPKNAPKSSKK